MRLAPSRKVTSEEFRPYDLSLGSSVPLPNQSIIYQFAIVLGPENLNDPNDQLYSFICNKHKTLLAATRHQILTHTTRIESERRTVRRVV
jgi:hypothetical protein